MDLSTIAAAAARVGTGEARVGMERLMLPPRLLLPLLQAQATQGGALAELARDVRAQVAGGGPTVVLVLPTGAAAEGQSARLDLGGGRQVPIPSGLRDALLAQLVPGAAAAEPPSGAAAASGSPGVAAAATVGLGMAAVREAAARAWVTGAQAQAATVRWQAGGDPDSAPAASVVVLRESARALAPRATAATRDQAMPAVGFDRPLCDSAESAARPVSAVAVIAARLQQEVERSGLFFEAHLAQWLRGTRSDQELQAELRQWPGAGHGAGDPTHANRVAAQLAVLDHQTVLLAGPGWPGQPLRLHIEREPPPPDAPADLPPVFSARLVADLPRLGRVEAQLRLAGAALATTVYSATPEPLAAHLDDLGTRLRARGIAPVSLQAVAA